MKKSKLSLFLLAGLAFLVLSFLPGSPGSHARSDEPLEFDSCTSILVGRLASVDGSTMTSHSCDSGTDRTWMTIVPNMKHKPGEMAKVYYEPKRTKGPNDPDRLETGEIPQVAETYAFLNAAYPIMNEHQLAIGETTIGSRRELVSENGIIDAPELYRLVLERAKTAREAIRVADELTKAYGYNDWGECFTFADTKEVWHFEIHGPGKGKKGAVWAAQRVPDDEIGVSGQRRAHPPARPCRQELFPGLGQRHVPGRRDGFLVEGEAVSRSSSVTLTTRIRERAFTAGGASGGS